MVVSTAVGLQPVKLAYTSRHVKKAWALGNSEPLWQV